VTPPCTCGETFGPLSAALLLPVLDVRGVLLLDAATFLISAALLGLVPGMPRPGSRRQVPFLADTRAGLRYLWSGPTVRAVALGYFAVVACNGVDDVALVFLATDTLGAGGSAVGLLLATVGIGLLAGYALLARTAARVPMVALLLVGFAVSSAGNLLTGLAGAVAAAFLVQAVRGLGIAGMDVAANTLLQRIVPPALLGRVFGSLYGAIGVAAALAYLLGGLLLDRTTPPITFVIAGAGGLLANLTTAAALRHAIREPPPGRYHRIPARGLPGRDFRASGGQTAIRRLVPCSAPILRSCAMNRETPRPGRPRRKAWQRGQRG
jgi:MFS family permease